MAIRKLNLQSVIDDESGFQLSRQSRSFLKYSEKNLELLIEVESGETTEGDYDLAVYWPLTLNWQPPNDQILISQVKRQEIMGRVDRSLKLLEIPVRMIDK